MLTDKQATHRTRQLHWIENEHSKHQNITTGLLQGYLQIQAVPWDESREQNDASLLEVYGSLTAVRRKFAERFVGRDPPIQVLT
jgi:hypothetical protein